MNTDSRRERVRRVAAKRPPIVLQPIVLEVHHAPRPQARERLVDLLVELLDPRRDSGRA